jgi:hypothetical protein
MASLLNNASLLLNPAGSIIAYEEDKILSVLPSNGTGDFTFSGGDGGTRVNQQGYIEKTPFNLFNYSNALNTSPWYMAVTGGQTGKDGAANAWLLTKAGASTSDYYNTKVLDGVQTVSFYIKKEASKGIKPYAIGGVTLFAIINIETGVVISKSAGVEVVVEEYSSTWWRIHVTANVIDSYWYWYVTNAAGTQIASTVTLQDMQLVNGAFIKPYQPTTDRLNYPRITYQNGRGALLSEPQRTNLLTYSEDLTNGVWNKTNVTITANDIISPDGTQNADRVTISGASSVYFYHNTGTASNRANSIFLKKGTIDQATILGNSYSSGTYATFNLSNGTIISYTGCTPFIEQYKDGWYRCGIIQTNGVNYVLLVTLNGYNNDTATSGDYLYAWGGQSELGTFPTTYIPTTSATVTRPVDIASKTGASSLINASEGVLYFDGFPETRGNYEWVWFVSNGSNNLIGITFGVNLIYGEVYNGSYQALLTYASTDSGRYKVALAYKANDFAMYVNGQLAGTDTSGAVPTGLSYIDVGYPNSGGRTLSQRTNTAALFNTRLTNAELATLTTVRSGSGGNISYYGPYTIHTFTGSATFTPSFTGPVEVLVVAGGGSGGGWYYAGGGGAGGVIYASSFGVSQGTGITVTIGAGGAQQTGNSQPGNDGSASSFGGLSAIGGGGGGGGYPTGPAGRDGGSGGGGGRGNSYSGGSGTPGQGNNGGNYNGWAGGGGGAGEAGTTGVNNSNPGNGGDGLPYSITGFSTYYGGGGAGAVDANIDMPETVIPQGGLGGGGNGATYINLNTAAGVGVTNTGGGGGGGCHAGANPTGAAGGSGIVIVRYLT